jgi:hypothetical protein
MPQHRNPVELVGKPPSDGFTKVLDELIREGGHKDALGSDGFLVVCYLLSRGDGWETSAKQIAEQFGWSRDRVRARNALDAAVKDRRLVIREIWQGGKRVREGYVLRADGRQFTDAEIGQWSAPITLPTRQPRRVHENHAGSAPQPQRKGA